ncbi:glycosyltransferase, partial [Psychroflexus sp. MES1-P1E]|uniref:glycosyltransferase n=1 Tax=Psychroflexus sp. MES1-P1E TaxID=2058320 RepID=UPI000C7A8EBE
EQPDIIVHNAKCNYPVIWGMKNKKRTVLVSPVPYFMYYVQGHSHIGFNKNFGTFINKLTYRLSNYGLVKTIYDSQKSIPEKLSISKKQIKENLFKKDLVYTISPSLFQRPNYWNENVQVSGYHERSKTINWEPSQELLDFLNNHNKVLFLTFGSMINSFPRETSSLIYNELNKLKIPVIVNTASGGLIKIDKFALNENFFFVNQIPYDWIFNRVYGVIHHGGSGTTNSALKYGCVTLIIPHIIDQFGWNNLISKLGAGPKGISINKLKKDKLNTLIYDLYNRKHYLKTANEISQKMKDEKLEDKLYKDIIKK